MSSFERMLGQSSDWTFAGDVQFFSVKNRPYTNCEVVVFIPYGAPMASYLCTYVCKKDMHCPPI